MKTSTRRSFLTLLGGAAAAWPLGAGAQQRPIPLIGFLHPGAPEMFARDVSDFHRGLGEVGFFEGRNLAVEYRWARGAFDRLPPLAADLAVRRPAVIVATGGLATVRAARDAAGAIPIIFSVGVDPVETGLVASLNRPGGTMTGVGVIATQLGPKRIELLHELMPGARNIAVLGNSTVTDAFTKQLADVEEAARALGKHITAFDVVSDSEIDAAFIAMGKSGIGALFVANNAFIGTRIEKVISLAARYAIPAVYDRRDFAVAGGLMSYGAVFTDSHRLVGNYTGRVLKGTKPADLPIVLPSRFELVINLKTAKAIYLTIPESFLVRADEVIE